MTPPYHSAAILDGAAASGNGDLILYIDPDTALCREVASHLANRGYRIMTTCQSLDAIQMVMAQRADVAVVIFDSAMPTIDGMPLARALHMVSPNLPQFVLVSSDTSALPTADKAINVRGLMRKPATTPALMDALAAALSSMRSQ